MSNKYNHNRANRDANQPEIVEAFEAAGCSVTDTTGVGGGFPDLVVGYMGVDWKVEIKQEKGKVKQSQKDFAGAWKGSRVYVVRSPEQVPIVLDCWRCVSREVEVIGPDQFRREGVI